MKLSPELRAIAVRRLRSVPIPVAKDGAASVSPQEQIVVLAEFDVDDCDWNAGEPEKLLSQLL